MKITLLPIRSFSKAPHPHGRLISAPELFHLPVFCESFTSRVLLSALLLPSRSTPWPWCSQPVSQQDQPSFLSSSPSYCCVQRKFFLCPPPRGEGYSPEDSDGCSLQGDNPRGSCIPTSTPVFTRPLTTAAKGSLQRAPKHEMRALTWECSGRSSKFRSPSSEQGLRSTGLS